MVAAVAPAAVIPGLVALGEGVVGRPVHRADLVHQDADPRR
jgi:hypothetical protein